MLGGDGVALELPVWRLEVAGDGVGGLTGRCSEMTELPSVILWEGGATAVKSGVEA